MQYGFVYIWKDKKHNRFYIGSHWGTENDGYICSSRWMRNAYKRRPEDFKRRILYRTYTTRQDLLDKEYYYLNLIQENELGKKYYNLNNKNIGHWSTDPVKLISVSKKVGESGRGKSRGAGRKVSEETKRKISLAFKGKKKPERSLEHRRKISENNSRLIKEGKIGMLGRKHTKETLEKMRNNNLGSNNPMFNRTHTEEARKNISKNHRSKKQNQNV